MYKRWLKALESGQYTELININLLGFRRVGNKYTALGVLIDINQHLGYHWIKVNEDYIVVSDMRNDIFYATIYLRDRDNNTITIDSRPSDAIALAVRVECNIFVKEDILDEYGIETTSPDEQYMEI